MRKWKNGFILLLICICYGMISLYSAYVALSKSQAQRKPSVSSVKGISHRIEPDEIIKHFDIWDTCGLGVYLWKNILQGEITRYNLNNGWLQSSLETGEFLIRYNLGYGLLPEQALTPSQPNIVLIINARDTTLVPKAKQWLDHVISSAYIQNVAVMLLGSEKCDNDWIQPYLSQKQIKCVFVVYDSPLVDDEFIYQWPLGVASYRNFQNFDQEFLDLTAQRQYVFNFMGTVYEGSSRVDMMDTVKHIDNHTKRYIRTRNNWVAEEDPESMANYQHILLQSDITLSPVGINSECYRTYEAMELGSIPVIEDVLTEGSCDFGTKNQTSLSPYRLLKKYKGPLIFVDNWDEELPGIVEKFQKMPLNLKVRSRINLIRWYVDFKAAMRTQFLDIIRNKFFKM